MLLIESLGFAVLISGKDFNSELWRALQDESRQEKEEAPAHPIYASDIDASYVDLASKNALRARVEKYMKLETASLFDIDKPAPSGIMLTNMPYGERLWTEEDFLDFYKKVGDHLKQKFTGWKIGLFVAEDSPWKFIGLKPTRKISLLNGSIKTKLLIFEI